MANEKSSPLPNQHPALGARLVQRFFRTPLDSVISTVTLTVLAYLAYHVLDWAVFNAIWTTPDGTSEVCRGVDGACWAVIQQRWRLILFGLFPYQEQWRSSLACVLLVVIVVMSCLPTFWTALRLTLIWVIGFIGFFLLMRGGIFGMSVIAPSEWGGLTLTAFFFVTCVLIGMPLAIALALLRRSPLPVVSGGAAIVIDCVRSLPLVTILFTAALILPFVLPGWLLGDKIWRVILGFALFYAVYQAEIIRGGIQSLPGGQDEAAKALGLSYFHRVTRIILPQAFRNALPPTINQLVITFKETSLIVIIGFFDVLASGSAAFGTGEWSFAYTEVYIFVALIYFVFVFSLSRYGAYLERRMRVGTN
ncbi:amino acid ABC transporter permease [Roseovarius sp. ZX-A-9]|uniref:amino acid ABC transporter permease n=1 Tax=Roseovarius sp. ZX-A-9 TaxID=3014783 RepID=UPI00232CF34B|nr:amino acid ABC transporter permease [Roseovarius sp. ZX-A-9]